MRMVFDLSDHADQVLSTGELLDLGLSRADIDSLSAWQRIRRLRRGWYWVQPQAERPPRPTEEYRARVMAVVRTAQRDGRDIVLAGPSAAVWWNLPWVGPVPTLVTVARPTTSGRSPRAAVASVGDIPARQVTIHRGVRVSTVPRTVVDVARSAQGRSALTIADHALHHRLANPDELNAALDAVKHHSGVRKARRILALADERAESPGESISRYQMVMSNIPRPELQVSFKLLSGDWARVDFLWREERLIGEFDGEVKYGNAPGTDPRRELIAEKRREDGLRELGYRMFRWTWSDIWNPAATNWAGRLRLALSASPANTR